PLPANRIRWLALQSPLANESPRLNHSLSLHFSHRYLGSRVFRIEIERGSVCSERLLHAAELLQRIAKMNVRGRRRAAKRQRLLEHLDRALMFTQTQVHGAKIVEVRRVTRVPDRQILDRAGGLGWITV